MKKITHEMNIDARMDKVFEFLTDPDHLPDFWPGFLEVKNIETSKSSDGLDFDWTYKLADTRIDGRMETIKFEQYKQVVVRGTKGMQSTTTWKLEPHGGKGTRLSFELQYDIPGAVSSKNNEQEIQSAIELQVEAMLDNLKQQVEGQTVYVAA